MLPLDTKVTVRVIARAGKFLGDDIGGAEVTIRDVRTGALLASGKTTGGSGPSTLMTTPIARTEPIPVADPPANDACKFEAFLRLDAPRLVEISAYGPLAAPESANWTRSTTWIYPGLDIAPQPTPGGPQRIDGFLLEVQGLLVQVLNPPAHYLPSGFKPGTPIPIRANVTMMCGCPISEASGTPWPAGDFDVEAEIFGSAVSNVKLDFDKTSTAPSQFRYEKWAPVSRHLPDHGARLPEEHGEHRRRFHHRQSPGLIAPEALGRPTAATRWNHPASWRARRLRPVAGGVAVEFGNPVGASHR